MPLNALVRKVVPLGVSGPCDLAVLVTALHHENASRLLRARGDGRSGLKDGWYPDQRELPLVSQSARPYC